MLTLGYFLPLYQGVLYPKPLTNVEQLAPKRSSQFNPQVSISNFLIRRFLSVLCAKPLTRSLTAGVKEMESIQSANFYFQLPNHSIPKRFLRAIHQSQTVGVVKIDSILSASSNFHACFKSIIPVNNLRYVRVRNVIFKREYSTIQGNLRAESPIRVRVRQGTLYIPRKVIEEALSEGSGPSFNDNQTGSLRRSRRIKRPPSRFISPSKELSRGAYIRQRL